MSLVEDAPAVKAVPLFGPITRDDMAGNPLLAKVVMTRVKEVCAHSKGRYTVQQIADGVASGVCSLWGVTRKPPELDAVIVTAPNADGALDVLLAGPEIEDVIPFLPRLDGIARGARCTKVRMMGPGFWKEHLPEGWRPMFTVYERAL